MNSVYVISADTGFVKIGVSAAPEKRMRVLADCQPHVLTLEYVQECGDLAFAVEAAAHRTLRDSSKRGEWFSIAADEAIRVVQVAAKTIAEKGIERPQFVKLGGEAFKHALRELGVSQHQFARDIEMDITTVNRWATNKAEIPGIAAAYVRLRLKFNAFCEET